MDDPRWISADLALSIHKLQLAEHGGIDGVRDASLLESALARPRHRFAYDDPTPTVPVLAASYGFGTAKNHPFLDGNKRTAAVVCETFLNLNRWQLTADDEEMYLTFYGVADGTVSETQLADWLSKFSVRERP